MRALAFSLLAAGGLLLAILHGCGPSTSGEGSRPDDASPPEAMVHDGGAAEGAPPGDAQPPFYSGVPSGWVAVEGIDPNCGIYWKGDRGMDAPSARWESCPTELAFAGTGCAVMAHDWQPSGPVAKPVWISGGVDLAFDGATPLLDVRRVYGRSALDTVMTLDGTVRSAVFEADMQKCFGAADSVADGHVVFTIHTTAPVDGPAWAVGGSIGGPLKTVARLPLSANQAFVASAAGAWHDRKRDLYAWNGSGLTRSVATPPEDDGYESDVVFTRGDAVVWRSGSPSTPMHIRVNTPNGGTGFLINGGPDMSRGAADFGTDGKDMVWVEGSGKTQPGRFPHLDLWTAPYSLDEATIKSTRRLLRNIDSSQDGDRPYVAGGYVIRYTQLKTPSGDWRTGSLLVRISDGKSWYVADRGKRFGWHWIAAAGMTATEVFALMADEKDVRRLVRFPLAALIATAEELP